MENVAQQQPGVRVWPGLPGDRLLELMTGAQQLVLHAALYSNFAHGPVNKLIRRRLASGELTSLTLIKLEAKPQWRDEFARVLRPGMAAADMDLLLRQSRDWCCELKCLAPAAVNLVSSQALPLQPILLLGDTVLAGQYAHSQETAAHGPWLELDSTALGLAPGTLGQWFAQGVPVTGEGWPRAIGRYVEECRQAAHDIWMLPSLTGECQCR
ncbi:hypothetical protein [Shewanella sp. GXUN23E]|uniref:hypothetical protein n=1 Tax=Shewanella sp. GXUN23E TaxID=3422498 RepID=UPI003D7D51D6